MSDAKTVRFGLIGCGAWGSQHARAIAKTPGACLAAIAEPFDANRAAAQVAHPTAAIYSDYRQMLAEAGLDAVDIVMPSHLHYAAARAVLDSGRHLLLEKPMCLRLEDCDDLIARAGAAKKHLAIGHEFRLSSLWGKVKEMVDDGAIGEPRYCLIELWRNPYRQGTGGWRYSLEQVGNWILEEPIHFFDLARWYFSGTGNPVSVFASASAKREDRPELQDNFSALLHFPKGGYAVISQTLAAYEHHQVVKLTGTRGALWASWSGAMDRTLHPTFSLKYFDGEKTAEIPITKITGEVFELEEELLCLTRACRGEPLRCATGEDGRWAVAMCLKAQESVQTGQPARFA